MMFTTFLERVEWSPSLVVALSRQAILLAWLYVLITTWKNRHLPYANQALAGALAMVLSVGTMLYGNAPHAVSIFFVAMAQIILANSFVQISRTANSHKIADVRHVTQMRNRMLFAVGLTLSSIQVLTALIIP